jgi:hypothetical protein
VIPALQEVDPGILDKIDDSMFLCNAPGPDPWGKVFERFRFPDALKWISQRFLDDPNDPQSSFSVGADPMTKVFQEFRLKNCFTNTIGLIPQSRTSHEAVRYLEIPRRFQVLS